MNRLICTTALLFAMATGSTLMAQNRPRQVPRVAGEILLRARGAAAAAVADRIRGRVVKEFNVIGWSCLKVDVDQRGELLPDTLRWLAGEAWHPNYVFQAAEDPTDPGWPHQWYLEPISIPAAWTIQNTSPNVVVAVIDTGMFYAHDDLSEALWVNTAEWEGKPDEDDDKNGFINDFHGWDFVDDDYDPWCERTESGGFENHGTAIAGIIGARGNNGVGIAGVTWQVQIMYLRALHADLTGDLCTLLSAMEYAILNGACILNCSWGGYGEPNAPCGSLEDMAAAADERGVLIVAAAGNKSDDNDTVPFFPAACTAPNVIAVAATDQDDEIAAFSNYGETSVDIAAPGAQMYSLRVDGTDVPWSGHGFIWSGTSYSVALVSGTLALLKAHCPSLSHRDLLRILITEVDPVSSGSTPRPIAGGVLNAHRAVAECAAESVMKEKESKKKEMGERLRR